jgi:hypothetical protein
MGPQGSVQTGAKPSRVPRFANGVLLLIALALMIYPIFDPYTSRPLQVSGVVVAVAASLGRLAMPQGSRLTFMLLWAAFGMSAALGTLSIFSVGYFYLLAAIALLFAIFATPNRSDIELRYDMRFIAAFAIGYLGMFFFVFVFAARF